VQSRLRGLAFSCVAALGACDQFAAIGIVDRDRDAGLVMLPPEANARDGGRDASVDSPPIAADAAMVADAAADAATDAGEACVAPTVSGCNPVTNEGCLAELSMQCAIDLATPLAGYCIFAAPNVTVSCLNTIVTESCAPTSACVDYECRSLCFCDSDCATGQCCSIPIGDLGFRACGDC
jgi:hypothetical protein